MKDMLELVGKAFNVLTPQDRHKTLKAIPILLFLSLLDLFGVILLGTVAAITFNLVASRNVPTRLELILQGFLPQDTSRTFLITTLSVLAVILLGSKTMAQALFSYRFGIFLAKLESFVAKKMYGYVIHSKISELNKNKFSEYQFALVTGANRMVNGIIGSSIYFVSDLMTTVLMVCFAIYASPLSTGIAIIVFTSAYMIFNGPISKRATTYGDLSRQSYLNLSETVLESFRGIKEIRIYSKEDRYELDFSNQKEIQSLVSQKTLWLNSLVRYFLEIAILLTGAMVALGLLVTSDLKHAITVTIIFIVIGFRLIPNIQRLQNSLNSLRSSRGVTIDLFNFLEDFKNNQRQQKISQFKESLKLDRIIFQNLMFSFTPEEEVLNNLSFELPANNTLIILGESGSGKSTLLDLVSGLHSPTSGVIELWGKDGKSYSDGSAFSFSYVTQDCALFGKDLYENITLTSNPESHERAKVDDIISSLNLQTFQNLVQGRSREIRTDHTNISGGERQRISIARAKFFNSEIVLMDEPTSALDLENESRVVEYIRDIRHKKTIIIASHAQKFLKEADFVLFLEKGTAGFFGTVTDFSSWREATDV